MAYDKPKIKNIPASSKSQRVEVKTSDYEATHGKKPRGWGMWAFKIKGETVFSPSMNYGEAKEWAKGEARKRGCQSVEVMG